MRNKLLAVLLALCMVLTLLPAMAFAVDGDGNEGQQPSQPSSCGCSEENCTCTAESPCNHEGCNNKQPDTDECTCGCNTAGCECSAGNPCKHTGCGFAEDDDQDNKPTVPTECTCGCVLAACSACEYDEAEGKIVCGCGGTSETCKCGKENLGEAPDGHCTCEEASCPSGSHRGGPLGEYGGSICVNVPEEGSLCEACRAYANSLKDDGQDDDKQDEPAPSQPVQPSTPAKDPSAPQKAEDFTDVDRGQWYNDDLTTMLEKGWFVGQAGGKFAPQDPTTGAEVVVILSRVLGQDLVTTGSAWASEATSWAADAGLSEGITITTSGGLARQDLILMLWRAAGKPESAYALSFTDIDSVSGDALTALRWAAENGIVKGNPDGTVSPSGATKRCEMAALMVRYDTAVNG